MKDLRLTIVQTPLIWEQAEANRQAIDRHLNTLKEATDLIILPEMFTTGFSMNPAKVAEPMDGPTVNWMKERAAERQAVICGSIIIEEDHHYYNRLLWVEASGAIQWYDKRHLFTLADEHKYYQAGQSRLIVDYQGWRICPLICYDLRFPVWSRNTVDYDLLIYVANWPETRAYHWKSLLIARAIENQAYTVGVNRVGEDGNRLNYSGDSAIIDYYGAYLFQQSKETVVHSQTLSYRDQQTFRKKLNFLADRD